MRTPRLAFVVAAVLACAAAYFNDRIPLPRRTPVPAASPLPAVTLRISYGDEKRLYVEDAVRTFTSMHPTLASGAPIKVEATPLGATEAMEGILVGAAEVDVWMPATSLMVDLLNDRWRDENEGTIVRSWKSIARSPLVVGMWEPMARVLGRPELSIGWSEMAALVDAPGGWAHFGHPDWGLFKLAHAHPKQSDSGLLALIYASYAISNKQAGLTSTDVARAIPVLRGFESVTVAYGASTGVVVDEMIRSGPLRRSAAIMFESDVIASYVAAREQARGRTRVLQHGDGPGSFPLVAIYPRDGTLFADHPYAILETPLLTTEAREAAELFRDYLLSFERQRVSLARFGFRPADPSARLGVPFEPSHGVDGTEPRQVLENPPVPVTRHLLESFPRFKRPLVVTFVVDASTHMDEAALDGARHILRTCLLAMDDHDSVRLALVRDEPTWVLEKPAPLAEVRDRVMDEMDALVPGGEASLYRTLTAATQSLAGAPRGLRHVVVVVSTGTDVAGRDGGAATLDDVLARLGNVPDPGASPLTVLTVAVGPKADDRVLRDIAQAGNGEFFARSPERVADLAVRLGTRY